MIVIYGLLLLICFQAQSAEPFRYRGYIQQFVAYDPQYLYPTIVDWRKDYWVIGPGLNTGNSIVGWGGTRMYLQTLWGTPDSPLYLDLPFFMYNRMVERGSSRIALMSNSFVMKAKSGLFQISLSSKRVAENPQWSYTSFSDPLGALKLPNTSAPMFTMKLAGNALGWDLTSYYLADNRCAFVPRTEEIPEPVYAALGETKEGMLYFDEIPTYRMLRGVKSTNLGTWGFLWGEKRAVNINPRSLENDNTLVNPNHGVGYIKQNLGIDFTGSISGLNGVVTAAAVKSIGDWYKYREHLNETPYNLGQISGDAVKITFSGLQFKTATISSSFIIVEPGFQWTAVRDSRYAYVQSYYNPEKPQMMVDGSSLYAYGWRAMRDEYFLLRNPDEKESYLSDVSTYLGLRAWETNLKYPSKISISSSKTIPAIFSLELEDIANLADGEHYYDQLTAEEIIKDYRQLKANLETDIQQSKLTFSAMQRTYKDQDYLQELSSALTRNLNNKIKVSASFGITKRLRDDDAQAEGTSHVFKANLAGDMDSGLFCSTNFDYRAGNYDYGLLKETKDHVLASEYTYWEFNQYLEQDKNLNLGKVPLRATLGAELLKRNSTLSQISGTSFIIYGRGIAKVTSDLTATVTLIDVSGPKMTQQKDKYPSNSLNDVIDCLLSYQLFGQRANTVNLRYTRRYLEDGIRNNVYTEFVSRMGAHTLRLTLGRAPIGIPTTYIAGTKHDVRIDNPEAELYKRPWAIWGANGILSDETCNNVTLSWNMTF